MVTDDVKNITIAAWECGYNDTPWGVRVGGMGLVVEELPGEMLRYAESCGKNITIEVLSPFFRFYDRSQFTLEETIEVPQFNLSFDVFSHAFPHPGNGTIKHLYFWNETVLGSFGDRTALQTIYPPDPWVALRVYARVGAAMAAYLQKHGTHAIHLHDYHVGLLPFYLDWKAANQPAILFTIHNAGYQGWLQLWGDPAPVMYEIGMPKDYYYEYFQYWGNFNTMKGILLYLPKVNGLASTVSENYAYELRMNEAQIRSLAQKKRLPNPRKVSVPNVYLSELAWFRPPLFGINNGLAQKSRPENEAMFQPQAVREAQKRASTQRPLLTHPTVRSELMENDVSHNYTLENYVHRNRLRELMYLECFNKMPHPKDIGICFTGRLDRQKNMDVIAQAIRQFPWHDYPNVHFLISTTAPQKLGSSPYTDWLVWEFRNLSQQFRDRVFYFDGFFNAVLAKLMFAGSDFCLMPSRFEPCGLVDYEAALLGCIPIIRETGGLKKTLPYSLSYAWYDDHEDALPEEAQELLKTIFKATELFDISDEDAIQLRSCANLKLAKDIEIVRRIIGCMSLDTTWAKAIAKYFGLLKI